MHKGLKTLGISVKALGRLSQSFRDYRMPCSSDISELGKKKRLEGKMKVLHMKSMNNKNFNLIAFRIPNDLANTKGNGHRCKRSLYWVP